MNEEEKNQPPSQKKKYFSNLRAPGTGTLAGLLYFLLLVATIETFRSESPVKWWVLTLVATYLGGTVVLWWRGRSLWQRFTWAAKARASLFVFLGLLALTAWLRGGLSNGLALPGLSTSTLLSLVTLAAVAISGIIVFQLNYPHPAMKWTIGGLSAYGSIAFLHGIFIGIPYVELLHGGGFWSKLPFFLQGTFIGALIILPLAVFIVGLRLLREVEARKQWPLQQTVALSMTLLMAVSGVIAPSKPSDPVTGYPTLSQYVPRKSAAVIKAVSLSSSENTYFDSTRVSTEFEQGIKQIVLWYRWTGANKGDSVNIAWFKDGEVIWIEEQRIEEPSGTGSLYLRRQGGEVLPAGRYQVELFENGNRVTTIPFKIGS